MGRPAVALAARRLHAGSSLLVERSRHVEESMQMVLGAVWERLLLVVVAGLALERPAHPCAC